MDLSKNFKHTSLDKIPLNSGYNFRSLASDVLEFRPSNVAPRILERICQHLTEIQSKTKF